MSAKEKHVEFNQDIHMKYITKITGVQTNSVKLAIHAKKPISSTSVRRSVLAKLRSEKETDKRNVRHYKKGTDRRNGGHYEKGTDKRSDGHYGK